MKNTRNYEYRVRSIFVILQQNNKYSHMRYKYKIKNFRVFDEDGVILDMAPITILTGCNSSGKSSIVKSMLLVNNVLKKLFTGGKLNTGIMLDFTEKGNNLLGTFDNVIHRGSESKEITIEYTVPSLLLNEDVVVSLKFQRHYKLNNGVLTEINISYSDGRDIFRCKADSTYEFFNDTTCHQDLRDPFFKYVFAKNNHVHLNYIQKNLVDEICDDLKEEDRELLLKKFETINLYYNSNKDWIDHLHNGPIPNMSFPPNFMQGSFDSEYKIGISNEQIFKGNLLYTPFLDSLLDTNKDEFESVANAIAKNGEDSDAHDLAICYIKSVANQFKGSEYDKFSEYFSHVYNDYFCKLFTIDEHTRSEIERYESLSGYDLFIGQPISKESLKDKCGEESFNDLHNLIRLLSGLSEHKQHNEIYAIQPNWYMAYSKYIYLVIEEILSYRIPIDIRYMSTSTVNIKRLYSFDEKDEMTELFKKYILSEPTPASVYTTWDFAQKWLKLLGIGEKLSVKALADGTGCEVRIFKKDDKKGQLLADFGYGISQLIYLLLRIEIEANQRHPVDYSGNSNMTFEEENEREMRITYKKPLTIVLEEPEVHLHPKYQSFIADILLDAYNKFNFHFIVETHSEYLIRKSQVLVSKMGFENNDESVKKSPFITYYIPENSKPYSLGYRKDGKFMETFGSGFYDESSNLAFELL